MANEITSVFMERPHVVILGAGASVQACPSGDRDGQRLPVMANFTDIVPVKEVLQKANIPFEGMNFEEVYSDLACDPIYSDLCQELQSVIYEYFSYINLPSEPTIYDYLVYSLRPKDVIATFNWDPFLYQASLRCYFKTGSSPNTLYLHGHVKGGVCYKDSVVGLVGKQCSECGEPFVPVPLLYPVKEKGYEKDRLIKSYWDQLKISLKNAFMLTVIGYGAPESDAAAKAIIETAWREGFEPSTDRLEIIDIKDKESLLESWEAFIHSDDVQIHQDYFDSWIARHPRRTGECQFWKCHPATPDEVFIPDNPAVRTGSLDELVKWCGPLLIGEWASEMKKLHPR